ncbi:MAG TPA: PD-(D/E)XK nuclease family protein, partial [Solirubrobacteraceae bacterium]|nr:PD-(D/E)XK nuclease family protein [Solirubrobacteraceae bacterium]
VRGRSPGPGRLRDPGLLAELRGRTWSASSLELWIACPAKWFVERMLRSGRPEPDSEPLARGGLAHAALRDTLAGLRERTGSARLDGARLGPASELLGDALRRHESDFPLSARPERVPGARRRLQVDLERYLRHAAAQDSPLEPAHLELGFGFEDEDGGLPALELGAGVRLRGRIDRIDVGPGGEAVVYDYKGGSVWPAAKWIADGKVQLALYMRAARELLGLEVVGGFYQPLAGADLRARGALDAGAGIGLECVQTDRLDRAELDALVDEAVALAREAAAQAVAGQIEARPQTCAYTGGCQYPAICRCGR